MTEFSAVSMRIETVGDREALAALDALDRKGRKVVDDAAGALGRAMGDVAVAYERGGKKMRQVLEDVAAAHRDELKELERQARAADETASRQAHATQSATRGLEMLGRTGALTGRSLDAVVSQVSALAFDFGPQGQLVAAIGITTAAIVEMFMRTSREMRKASIEAAKDFDSIAHRDVRGQGEAASLLYSGDPFNFQQDEDGRPVLARFGLEDLRRQRAQYDRERRQVITGAGTGGGAAYVSAETKEAEKLFTQIDAEIKRREAQLQTILGAGGTMQLAAQRQESLDMAGFVTSDLKTSAKAETAAQKLAKRLAEAYQRELGTDMKSATKLAVAQMVADAETTFAAQHSIITELVPTKKQIDDAIKQVALNISLALENDPVIAFQKSVKDMARRMREELARTLGEALSAGFEAAFSGKGITGAFEALTATVLAGLGGFMEALGAQMIIVGLSLDTLATALLSLNGPAAIAAGVGLIAAGAALKAVAGSFGHSQSYGGGGYGGGYSPSAGVGAIIDRGVINPDSYTSTKASSVQPRPQVNLYATIFGTNDANAQRGFDEMMRKSLQRGSLAGAGR